VIGYANGIAFLLIKRPGLIQWEAGQRLAETILDCQDQFKDKCIIELGSGGVPLPSLAACRVGARKCWTTDGCEEVVSLAKRNAQRNEAANSECLRLIWGDQSDVTGVIQKCDSLDWILAADVVYSEKDTQLFFDTVKSLLLKFPTAKLLLCYMIRGVSYSEIFQKAEKAGLRQVSLPEALDQVNGKDSIHLSMFDCPTRSDTECGDRCHRAMATVGVTERWRRCWPDRGTLCARHA